MNRDDIIRMAREAGFSSAVGKHIGLDDDLERFAALVAAAEREACAKVCEEYAGPFNSHRIGECAAAIRARGQDPMPLFDDWPGGWKK
jgi:hypothetical protein